MILAGGVIKTCFSELEKSLILQWRCNLSVFSDLIVYIWMLPVVVQILLPLVMLVAWLINRLIGKISDRKQSVSETMGGVSSRPVEEAA